MCTKTIITLLVELRERLLWWLNLLRSSAVDAKKLSFVVVFNEHRCVTPQLVSKFIKLQAMKKHHRPSTS